MLTANTTMLEPASGRPNFSSARALARSRPKRTGLKTKKRSTDAAAPLSRPIARLIAPKPCTANTIETAAPSQLFTWSAIILRSWRNCRCSMAAGAAARPSAMTFSDSTRTTEVALGAPIAQAKTGAPA